MSDFGAIGVKDTGCMPKAVVFFAAFALVCWRRRECYGTFSCLPTFVSCAGRIGLSFVVSCENKNWIGNGAAKNER